MDIKLKNNSNLKHIAPLYTGLDYIESTGTQYIDTEASFRYGFRIVTTIVPTLVDNNHKVIAGCEGSYDRDFVSFKGSSLRMCFGGSSGEISGGNILADNEYLIDVSTIKDNMYIKINGTIVNTTSPSNYPYTYLTCWLFDRHTVTGSVNCPYFGKLGRTQLYNESGTLVRDFIPAIDNSNVVCMFDLVSKRFFYNSGTGNFLPGNQTSTIAPKINSLYIKDCPYLDGIDFCKNLIVQESVRNTNNLQRIRIDALSKSDTIETLLQLKRYAGFSDDYQTQVKPRICGDYTITNKVTTRMLREVGFDPDIVNGNTNLTQNSTVFDGLSITLPSSDAINKFNIQSFDPDDDGYNPFFALLFNAAYFNNSVLSDNSIGFNYLDVGLNSNYVNNNVQSDGKCWCNFEISSMTDVNNNVLPNTGQTWTFDNAIDYDKMHITLDMNMRGICYKGISPNVTYYFPKEYFYIQVCANGGAADAHVLGSSYHYKGSLSEYVAANLGTYAYYPYFRNAFDTLVATNIYIDADQMELGDYDAADINACFVGMTSIPPIFMISKAHITHIPNNALVIEDNAFTACENAAFELPSTITTIGRSAFTNSKIYGTVDLPNLTSIELGYTASNGIFSRTNISSVVNLGNITRIPDYCFSRCTQLATAFLSNNIDYIGNRVFYGDTSLVSVTIEATTPPTLGTEVFAGCTILAHIYVPSASVSDYQTASGWSSYATIIEPIQNP